MTDKFVPKIPTNYECKLCDYIPCTKKEYDTHLLTHDSVVASNGLTNADKFVPKIPNNYECKLCDYISCNKKDYTKHLLTIKHIRASNDDNSQKSPYYFKCDCGKTYKHRQSLHKHRISCSCNQDECNSNTVVTTNNNTVIPIDHASLTEKMIELVMSKNQEFMNVFMDKIVHILPSITNNNTNSHNTNNNQFNIQMFLNEHCKNAMNISDFIKSLPLTAQHYENTKDNGLADTLTNLMVDGLNNLDVVERPIHCTDQKRKVMYVRDNNKWEKDTNNDIVTKNVKDLTCIHRANVDMWQEKNPKFNTDEDLQIALSVIIGNLFTDIIGEKKGISKLMKGVIDATYLDDNVKKGFANCDTLASV
jgi:hypothetical protein